MKAKIIDTGEIIEIESVAGHPISYYSNPTKFKYMGLDEYINAYQCLPMYETAGIEPSIKIEKYEAKGFPYNYLEENKPVYSYYVIHKLREGESLNIGAAYQLVTVVMKESVAKDICEKYKLEGYRLEYARVDIGYEC